MGKSLMGPGFRFKPTDVELLQYYLKRKIMGRKLHSKVIAELDIYKYEPWDLPDKSSSDSGDLKWYFFCPREKKYNNGNRIKRGTGAGYWKATGNDRSVVYCGQVSGWIKTLVFHTGKPPRGDRTDWVMHEYRLENQALADKGVALDSYVICMFFQKEGPGPRNGAQYGVPFKEEDWSDDEVEISSEAVQESNIPESDLRHLCNHNNPVATIMHSPEDIGTYASSASCIFDILPFSSMAPQLVSSNYLIQKKPHASDATNDISLMEKNTFFTKEKENAGMRGPYLIPPTDSAIGTHLSEGIGTSPFESSTSVIVPPPCNFLQPDAARYVTAEKPHVSYGDDILSMFDCFIEKSAFCMHEVDNNEVDGWLDSFPNRNMPEPDPVLVNNDDNSIAACGHSPMVIGLGPSFEAWRFDVLPPSCNVPQLGSCSYVTMEKPRASNGDDILPMMDCFSEESTFVMNELDKTEEPNDGFHFGNANATHHFDTSNVGGVLADSGNFTIVGEVGNVFSSGPDDYMRDFLELGDLDQPQHPSHFF